ncbi:sensory box/GGDEF family domain protein, partial [Vibrio parahaemolyticus V-223/04]
SVTTHFDANFSE